MVVLAWDEYDLLQYLELPPCWLKMLLVRTCAHPVANSLV
jgi:hypothetical protein